MRISFVVAVLAPSLAMVGLPSAKGQVWSITTGITSGGCPTLTVPSSGAIVQQCAMANAMAGIDSNDSNNSWRTTFRLFNRDRVAHNGTEQSFVPDGSSPYSATWMSPIGISEVTTGYEGPGIAPLGSYRFILTGATSTTLASPPIAVTLTALKGSDGLPVLIGETLVEQVDVDGNTLKAYAVADPATIITTPGTSFGVQMDVGYSDENTLIVLQNPERTAATVQISFWAGWNDLSDFAVREATEVFATTTITVPPATEQIRRPLFARPGRPVGGTTDGQATFDFGSFCSADANCQKFLETGTAVNGLTWPSGTGPGTQTLVVFTSNTPVIPRVSRVIVNPDESRVTVSGFAFPLIPQTH